MSFSITGVSFLMLSVLLIIALGYALGRITIKGVSLGDAGVFVVALLFGALFPELLQSNLTMTVGGESVSYATNALKIIETLGLILFVTAVGFIAGPKFFKNFKQNYKSYVLLSIIIILSGGLAACGCLFLGRLIDPSMDVSELSAMMAGLFAGSLTSTPAFSAAKEAAGAALEPIVSVGYGIAYLFGVVGVVLFVQLIPKLSHANMEEEVKKITTVSTGDGTKREEKQYLEFDHYGIMPFSLAALLGIIVGAVKFFGVFNLTTTGGALLVALIFGHFYHIGPIKIMPREDCLKVFRELGLILFLIGAGISGGMNFVKYFQPIYFAYGVVITVVPMVIGFLFAKYVLKLPLLNNLGSITGGMTSTPALGTLINVAKTEDVAAAYAATYPFALICVVIVAQLIIRLF